MEFGILGAEPSGSFHEEEVVGHGVSEEADRSGVGDLKGLWVKCPPLFGSCTGTPAFGKEKGPEC